MTGGNQGPWIRLAIMDAAGYGPEQEKLFAGVDMVLVSALEEALEQGRRCELDVVDGLVVPAAAGDSGTERQAGGR